MSKAEWGLKRICPSCATRYYDMKKNPPVCPKCGTVFDAENLLKTRRGRAAAEDKARKPAAPEELEDLPEIDTDPADDTIIEDADELGEDDTDMDVEVEEREE